MKKVLNFILTIAIVSISTISFGFSYTQEQIEAFKWAYKNKIISQPNIQDANLNWKVTRQALSKMIINYIENVAGVPWDISDLCSFTDENKITNDLKYHTKKICAYKIIWKNRSNFKPTQAVSRAQLGTVLSRVLWWDKHNSIGKWYYIYHVNALQDAGIMKNIKNVTNTQAKRWDVLVMLKRMYDKFGSNIYLNSWSWFYLNSWSQDNNVKSVQPTVIEKTKNPDEDYVSSMYSGANVIYTWSDWTLYYYDDKFLKLLWKAAKNKWESNLTNYLKIESEYFKNGLDQLSNLDDEALLKSIWIDINTINPDKMTKQEKQDLIKNFKAGFGKIINENKEKNNKLLKDLESVVNNVKNDDKYWLKEKYKNTKTFIEASNLFLDKYAESIFKLMEIALMDDSESSKEEVDETFWLLWIALVYQEASEKYQEYIEKWGVKTVKLLWLK